MSALSGSFSKDRKEKAEEDAGFSCLKNVHIFRTKLFLRGLLCFSSFQHDAVIFGSVFFPRQTSCAVAVKEKMKRLRRCLSSTKAFLHGDRWYIYSASGAVTLNANALRGNNKT